MSWQEGKLGRSYDGVCCMVGSQRGGGRIMRAEAGVRNKLVEVWGFAESDRGRFDEEPPLPPLPLAALTVSCQS